MFYAYQNISIHIVHKKDKKLCEGWIFPIELLW